MNVKYFLCFVASVLIIGQANGYAKTFEKKLTSSVKQLLSKEKKYEPTWDSIDSRPLPSWYDFTKLGIFIHWGVFSVPGLIPGPAWGWYFWKVNKNPTWMKFMADNYRPDFTYADFASQFTAEFYDPDEWADLFKASGAGYMVLTSKHHEGYCNWHTNVSWNWNSMDVGPHRDLVGELANSIRKRTKLHFGLYHSLYEFFNPLYLKDKANGFHTNDFVMQKTLLELYEIVNAYKPDIIWSDGQWEAPSWYWNSTVFLAWLYNESPVKDSVVTNDRWGSDTMCKHGGYLTCTDKYNPSVLQKRKYENAMTISKTSWGWGRNTNINDFISTKEMLQTFVQTISCGGNMLMNVGPTKAGVINPILQERLVQMGQWLSINGQAVYGSKPWRAQNDTINPHVWYTCQPDQYNYLKAKQTTEELRLSVTGKEELLEKKKESLHFEELKWKRYFEGKEKKKPLQIVPDFTESSFPIFVFVLEWPETNILVLGEPVNGTESSRVIMLGIDGPEMALQWTSLEPKGIAIQMPTVPISRLPHHLVWVIGLYGFN